MSEALEPGKLTRIRTTPLIELLRGRITGRLNVNRRIDSADLPAPAAALIKRVVKRSRLFARERLAVADELVAHFADGLAAGEYVDKLIAEFGDEMTAAVLMRRAKRRIRPRWLRAVIVSAKAAAVLMVIYSGIGVYFSTGRPTPTVDYAAQLNAAALAVPESGRAWPLYRAALLTLPNHGAEHSADELIIDPNFSDSRDRTWSDQFSRFLETYPTHPRWRDMKTWLDAHAETLRLTREGAAKPHLGFLIGPNGSAKDRALYAQAAAWWTSTDESRDPLTELYQDWGLLELNYLNSMLALHAALSRERDDAAGVAADLTALLRIARQTRSTPSMRVQAAMQENWTLCIDELEHTLAEKPALLSDAQLHDLAHELSGPDVAADLYDLTGERAKFMNAMQKAFTDDHAGSGRLTPAGLWQLGGNWDIHPAGGCSQIETAFSHISNWMTAPAAYLCSVSRAGEVRTFETRFVEVQSMLSTPMRNRTDLARKADTLLDEASRQWQSLRHFVAYRVMDVQPSIGDVSECMLGRRDGLLVGIALELYRRKTGNYPTTLASLVPGLLPAIPADRITGGPLSYQLIDGKPIVYSFGADRNDDHGHVPPTNAWLTGGWRRTGNSPDGDWVLYSTDPDSYPLPDEPMQ